MIWPNLKDTATSKDITQKVAHFLRNSGVKVLDLTPHLQSHKPQELMVNSMDGHPNERTHAEVAELLYEAMSPWNGATRTNE